MICYIIDIDGTVADFKHREHLVQKENPTPEDWDNFCNPKLLIKDPLFPNVLESFEKIKQHPFVFLTGRNVKLLDVTKKWIEKNLSIKVRLNSNLFMRNRDNLDLPTVYKEKLIKHIISKIFKNNNSIIAIDDDLYMRNIYEKFGILVLKAPECWNVMTSSKTILKPETAWRK